MVMTWQNGRQLKSIKVDDTTTLEFTYDINGQRQSKVEKKNGAAVHTTKYYYDGTKLVGENKDGTIVWYDYDENGTPVGMRLNGEDYVFRRNLQGDITGIFDSTGTLVVEYTYGNSWGFGITVSGSKAAEIGACNSLRYRGYYYDSESGLYYLNTRYYDPSICRFVNADGYVSTGQGTQGYNMYSYCGFNPVMRVDKSGDFWSLIALGCVALGCVVFFSGCSSSSNQPPSNYIDNKSTNQNCYSYAFGLPHAANPGDYSANNASERMYYSKKIYSTNEIANYVQRDMTALNKKVRIVKSPAEKLHDEFLVAMKSSTNVLWQTGAADYHFALQLSDGTWADKPGSTASRWNKIDGTAITWDLGNIKDYYNTETVYFAVVKE